MDSVENDELVIGVHRTRLVYSSLLAAAVIAGLGGLVLFVVSIGSWVMFWSDFAAFAVWPVVELRQAWRARAYPPKLTKDGIVLRVWDRYRYDVLLTWPQVGSLSVASDGGRPALLIEPRDIVEVADGDPNRLDALRRRQARSGAALVVGLDHATVTVADIDDAVQRLSQETHRLSRNTDLAEGGIRTASGSADRSQAARNRD